MVSQWARPQPAISQWITRSFKVFETDDICQINDVKHKKLDCINTFKIAKLNLKMTNLRLLPHLPGSNELVKLTFICQESEPFSWLNTVVLISGNLITIPIISGWLLTGSYQLRQAHLLPLTGAERYKIGTSLWLAGEADSCNKGVPFLTTDQEKKSWIRVRFLCLTQIRTSE